MRSILCVNHSTVVPPADFARALAVMSDMLDVHLGPAWGVDAELVAYAGPNPVGERIYLLDNSDQADALGYHELLASTETPVGFAFAKTALQAGVPWESVFSHETWEQVVDPWTIACVLAIWEGKPAVLALEVADPVEGDYVTVKGLAMSDYVTPAWFGAAHAAGARLDAGRLVTTPLTLRPGGYQAWSGDLTSWHNSFAAGLRPSLYRAARNACRYSRCARRLLRCSHV